VLHGKRVEDDLVRDAISSLKAEGHQVSVSTTNMLLPWTNFFQLVDIFLRMSPSDALIAVAGGMSLEVCGGCHQQRRGTSGAVEVYVFAAVVAAAACAHWGGGDVLLAAAGGRVVFCGKS
jgi:hypothetical protein